MLSACARCPSTVQVDFGQFPAWFLGSLPIPSMFRLLVACPHPLISLEEYEKVMS